MGVNGIYSNNISDMYTANTTAKEKTESVDKTDKTVHAESKENTQDIVKPDNTAAIYDKTKLSEDDRKAIVAQLKADQEKRQTQLTDLVHSMISKQTSIFGQATDIWKFLAKGDFEVDEETKKKAQEDIKALQDVVGKLTVASGTVLGLVKSSTEENKIKVLGDGTMEVNSLNVNKLI